MFLNALEHMTRRRLILIIGILSVLYLLLYWRGIASADPRSIRLEAGIPASDADLAYAALTIAGSMLSVMVWGLTIILGASILPDEMDAGRMSIWLPCHRPVSGSTPPQPLPRWRYPFCSVICSSG